jgi:hypothetical protein
MRHFINVKHYTTRPSHKTTMHSPCARTRNRHDRSLCNMQPSSPGNRQIDVDPRTGTHHEQRTGAVNGTQHLRCMASHAHGSVAVKRRLRRRNAKYQVRLLCVLADCAATLLACSTVHTTGFTRCGAFTDDATPESGW